MWGEGEGRGEDAWRIDDALELWRPSGLWAHNHLESGVRSNKSKISLPVAARSPVRAIPSGLVVAPARVWAALADSRSPRILALISLSLRKYGQHFPVCWPSGHQYTHPLVLRRQSTPHHTQPPPRAMRLEGRPRGPDPRGVSSWSVCFFSQSGNGPLSPPSLDRTERGTHDGATQRKRLRVP